MLVSQAGLARRLGVSKSVIFRAVKKGRITLTAEGKVDLEPALLQWADTKDHTQDRKGGTGHHPGDDSYHNWQTRKVKAQALRAEMEVETKRSTLLSAERVDLIWKDVVSRITAILDRIPAKGAAACAGKKSAEIQVIMKQITDNALHEVADMAGGPALFR